MSNNEIPEGIIEPDPEAGHKMDGKPGGWLYNGNKFARRAYAEAQYRMDTDEPMAPPNPADYEVIDHGNGVFTFGESTVRFSSYEQARSHASIVESQDERKWKDEQYRLSPKVELTPEQEKSAVVNEARARCEADGNDWNDPAIKSIYYVPEKTGKEIWDEYKRNK